MQHKLPPASGETCWHIKLEIAESGKTLGSEVSSSDCGVVVSIPARNVGDTGSNPVSQRVLDWSLETVS